MREETVGFTTGLRGFAECLTTRHLANSLPSTALGKPHSEKKLL